METICTFFGQTLTLIIFIGLILSPVLFILSLMRDYAAQKNNNNTISLCVYENLLIRMRYKEKSSKNDQR
ncbi:MAG: hypothetical protein RSA98_06745 [Odoribacter sp.]